MLSQPDQELPPDLPIVMYTTQVAAILVGESTVHRVMQARSFTHPPPEVNWVGQVMCHMLGFHWSCGTGQHEYHYEAPFALVISLYIRIAYSTA